MQRIPTLTEDDMSLFELKTRYVRNYLTFAGKNSKDFLLYVSGPAVYNSPATDMELQTVPGRNGDLIRDNAKYGERRYKNVDISYDAFFFDGLAPRTAAVKSWLLSPAGYADSLSGLSAEKRPEFMQMIRDAQDGKIDRILCKSVSRFSRNVAECKKYTDMLRLKNVTVEFEKENLRTDDPTSAFIFSLMSAIAENESRSISENIRWGYRERYKRGEYNLGNNRILGYDSVDGKLVPNQDADIIRLIYTLFIEDRTVKEIIRTLTDLGVTTRNVKPLSRNAILYILKNETYKGDKLLQKQPPKDFITKKPDPNAEYESNYLENDHEPIVERNVWDAVAAKLKKNKDIEEVVGHRGGKPHSLYGKVFCECGAPMTRRMVNGPGGEKIKTWICRDKRKGTGCKGRNVKEEELLKYPDASRIVVKGIGLEVG